MGVLILGCNRPDAAPEFFFNQAPPPVWNGREPGTLTSTEVVALIQFCSEEAWRQGYNDASNSRVADTIANPFHPEFLEGRAHAQWAQSYAEGAHEANTDKAAGQSPTAG